MLFHRQFPEKFIKPWRLRMIYRVNLIKRKTIRITKVPRRMDNSRYDGLKNVMRERLRAAIKQKRKIIWLDETMFTKTTNLEQEWSKRNKNIWLPVERINTRYTAVIAAISEGYGFEYFELHDCAVDSEIFCGFIRQLRQLNQGKQITVVMDNLTAHKTQNAIELMRELNIEWIWVVPYSPEYNAIELPFSQVKKVYK